MNSRTSMAQREDVIRRTVYVSEIDHQVTEEQLAALFITCGQVVDCRVCGNPNSVLRFAFIEFTDEGNVDHLTYLIYILDVFYFSIQHINEFGWCFICNTISRCICTCWFSVWCADMDATTTVEVCLKPSSTARIEDVRSAVERMLEKRSLSYIDGSIAVPLGDSFLVENVQRICICDTDEWVDNHDILLFWQVKPAVHVFQLSEEGPCEELSGDGQLSSFNEWILPTKEFDGMWERCIQQKTNPFGSSRPREVVLQERGIDWRKLDEALQPHSHSCIFAQKEKPLKENIPAASTAQTVGSKQPMHKGGRGSEQKLKNVKAQATHGSKVPQSPQKSQKAGEIVPHPPPLRDAPRALLPN